jgi:hypothetical protein
MARLAQQAVDRLLDQLPTIVDRDYDRYRHFNEGAGTAPLKRSQRMGAIGARSKRDRDLVARLALPKKLIEQPECGGKEIAAPCLPTVDSS